MDSEKKRPIDASDSGASSLVIKRPKLGGAKSDVSMEGGFSEDLNRCEPLALIKKDTIKTVKQEKTESVSEPSVIHKNDSKQMLNKSTLEYESKCYSELPLSLEKGKQWSEENSMKKKLEITESKDKISIKAEFNGSSQADSQINKETRSDSDDPNDESVKSEGSEKENVDLKKDKTESLDVIMLSDEDDETGDPATRRSRLEKKVKAYQNQLRNEEATLVLLKKLRQSQIAQQPETTITPSLTKPQSHHPQLGQQPLRHNVGPASINRGNQPNSKALHNVNQSHHGGRGQQVNNTLSRSQQGPPPLVVARSNGQNVTSQHPSHSSRANAPHNLSRSNASGRSQPNVPQQPIPAVQRQPPTPQVPPPPPPPPQDTQTPAQRQAAAKQALRKQLEKTLLQIPPPKPPPPEMNFIPSLACPDFILLIGLEEVVNHMIDLQLIARGQKNPDERFVCTPFTCVQCGSDFTPVWKREKPGSKNVICEHCVTSNQKKALKQEHTNRLKSAFVKALQQEQEIERMQASTPTPSPQPASSPASQQQLPTAPMISAASAAAAAANAAAAAAVANFRPSAEQLRQHHSFFQAPQLRAGQPLGLQAFSRSPFQYNISLAKQQDLQRQYLLDMIPRGSMPWKQ